MTPEELLQTLRSLGATVETSLRVEAPPGAITAELRDALQESKPAFLRLPWRPPRPKSSLATRPAPSPGRLTSH